MKAKQWNNDIIRGKKAFVDSARTNSASLEDKFLFCVFAAFSVT